MLEKELRDESSTIIPLNECTRGEFIVQYAISLSNYIIIVKIIYKADSRIKLETQISLSAFDC